MTKTQFKKLKVGTPVWFAPPYLAYPFPGIVKRVRGSRGIWINFFGDGQCLFVLRRPEHYEWVYPR